MRRARGFTLIEVLVAMAVLVIGGLSTLQLITILINSNHTISASTDATALANQLVAEIVLAEYEVELGNGRVDTGLLLGPGGASRTFNGNTGPTPNSEIRTFGFFAPGRIDPVGANQRPRYEVSYTISPCDVTVCPVPPNAPLNTPGGIEIVVTVDNFRGAVGGLRRTGDGALIRPINLVLRKEISDVANRARGRRR